MTTTAEGVGEQLRVSRAGLKQLCDVSLIVSSGLTPIFWVLVFGMLLSGKVVPGVPALFVGGITLLAAGFWFQLPEVKKNRTWQAWTLLAFFGVMTLMTAAAAFVIVVAQVPWTLVDTIALPSSIALAPIIRWFLSRFDLGNRIAWIVAIAASTKVGLQLVVAVVSIILVKCMPLPIIGLIFAFGMTRFPAIIRQLLAHNIRENRALFILEVCNAISVILLFVAWLAWAT